MQISRKRIYGRRVRELRKLRGLGALTLARLSQTNEKTIKSFERGQMLPSVETCYEIMKSLESNVHYLITGKNDERVEGEISVDIVKHLKELSLRDLEVVQKMVRYLANDFDIASESKSFYEWKLEKIMESQSSKKM